jgi:hypothetical protein
METIQLSTSQHEQMAGLIMQLSTARQIAEAFVGYFAKELGVNLQLYQFNADNLAFEPIQVFEPQGAPPMGVPPSQNLAEQIQAVGTPENGRIEAI